MKEQQNPVDSVKQAEKRGDRKNGLPWWLSILLAIASYCIFKYLVPGMDLENPTLRNLAQAAPSFAPITAIPFLLLAAKQLYDSDIDGRDKTTDSDQNQNQQENSPEEDQTQRP